MILDDGGDATLLVHKGVEFEKAGDGARSRATADSEEFAVVLGRARPVASADDPRRWTADRQRDPRRHRGDDHRRAPALRDAAQRASCSSRPSTSTTR